MNDFIVWIIIAAFYAPLHYLLPVLIIFLREEDPVQRKSGLRRAIIISTISMLVAFAIVIWLVGRNQISIAMAVLFTSFLIPLIQAIYQTTKNKSKTDTV